MTRAQSKGSLRPEVGDASRRTAHVVVHVVIGARLVLGLRGKPSGTGRVLRVGTFEAPPRLRHPTPGVAATGLSRAHPRQSGSARTTAKIAAFQRAFTMAIKSVNGGPSCNQMEDANTKWTTKSSVVSPHDVQPDRGRVSSSLVASQGRLLRSRPFCLPACAASDRLAAAAFKPSFLLDA
jgi:hypothetical protein